MKELGGGNCWYCYNLWLILVVGWYCDLYLLWLIYDLGVDLVWCYVG